MNFVKVSMDVEFTEIAESLATSLEHAEIIDFILLVEEIVCDGDFLNELHTEVNRLWQENQEDLAADG